MTDPRRPGRIGLAVLAAGYVCMLAVVVNIAARFGWIHLRLPFLTGFGARWVWGLGAVACFILTWYIERDRNRPRT
jgi:hypothetical protein